MEATAAAAAFDVAELKQALERSDAEALIRLYADEARMTIVDRHNTPSQPRRLTGRDEIAAFWRDVCARPLTHQVSHAVAGADRVALVEECAYPDGCRVLAATTLALADGRIVDHLTVQAWDEVGTPAG